MSTLDTMNDILAGDFLEEPGLTAKMDVDELLALSVAVDRYLGGFIKMEYSDHGLYNYGLISDIVFNINQSNKHNIEITDQDREYTEKIKEYFSGLVFKALTRTLTDFEKSVVNEVTTTNNEVTQKRIATVCALPSIYRKNLIDDAWAVKENSLKGIAGPEGVLGRRQTYQGKIVHLRVMKKTNSTLVVVLTENNNIVKFFQATNGYIRVDEKVNMDDLLKVGNTVNFSGLIKRQCPSKVTKTFENVVNRVKIHNIQLQDK